MPTRETVDSVFQILLAFVAAFSFCVGMVCYAKMCIA